MKIKLNEQYKSLQPFESEELESLTIITGKNGSGKTQLLSLISQERELRSERRPQPGKGPGSDTSSIHIIQPQSNFELIPKIELIQSEGITIVDNPSTITGENWKKSIENYSNTFKNLKGIKKDLYLFLIENNITLEVLKKRTDDLLFESDVYKELLVDSHKSHPTSSTIQNIPSNLKEIENRTIPHLLNPNNIKLGELLKYIAKYRTKSLSEITYADFYNTPIPEHFLGNNQLFSSKLELVFYNYAKRRVINKLDYLDKRENEVVNDSIPDKDFIKQFIPPWDLINQVLSVHNLDFYFKGVEIFVFSQDLPLKISLHKKSSDIEIQLTELSSGEKTIIGLILKLFTSEYYNDNLTFPNLLILDEPDAKLHPEMSKLLLEVLQKTFVEKYKIKVIMTTHSPSTIALAPEECIYELKNEADSSLKKVSKDEALQILTNFIPTLSIDYKSHKQVFVESPTDVEYYQILHDKYQQSQKPHSKLYFISNGHGKGNCNHVYEIVKKIRESGNKTAYGIADWDLDNEDEDFTFVHGINERYSVENFVLDPLYLIVLLMDLDAHNIFQETVFENTYNHLQIGNESNEKLRGLVKYFFEKFEDKHRAYKYDVEKVSIEYHNGKKVEIPKWYLEHKGHELERKIKQVFPALEKFRNEGDLQKKLSLIMGKCYPFVPKPSIDIIEKILNHSV